jgi:hypothetical protein
MAQVNFKVTISGGVGIGVFIKIGSQVLHFPTSGTQSVDLNPDDYVAPVSGAEPSDTTVNIEVSESGTVLQTTSFSDTTFWGLLAFTVF